MTDSGPEPEATTEELSFEEALERLEEIVEDLEGGQMTLEDSLKRFQEGMGLRALCLGKLQDAETKIEQVLADAAETDPEGGPSPG